MKPKLLLCLCSIIGITLSAQVAGPNNPNTFTNALIPGFSYPWINITNVQLDDENFASFGNLPEPAGSHTDYLQVTNFSFNIPAGAIIDGIKVDVKCMDPNSRTSDYSIRIVKSGAVTGDEKAAGIPYPVSENFVTYGGASDLWGETWDHKFINDNQFGVAIAAQRNTNDDILTAGQVNNIRITVYYTLITLPVTLTSFTATMQNKSVNLNWQTSLENDLLNYKVERSDDGRIFKSIAIIQSLNTGGARYRFTDKSPLPGVSYYRLNIEGLAGYQKYSQIVSVRNNDENQVSIFPSLWKKGNALYITNKNSENITVHFYNTNGLLIDKVLIKNNLVPAESLINSQGLIYYKVTDQKMNILGKGNLQVY